MSKKGGVYKVGDYVFGKVKYWPPWPAKILKINKKTRKYGVIYYGTDETGNLKIEDLCLYEENKALIINAKNMRRFDFRAGIEQIENEILRKVARAIELALEDNDSSNMNEGSLKKKIDDDISA